MTKHMLTAMAGALALTAATPVLAQQQGGSTVTTATVQGPILSFSVNEEVRSRPDQATVGAGVQTTAPTAVEAMRLNAAAMDKLIAAAKARGIKPEDIQTSGINLSPQYDYNNTGGGQPPRFIGYQVNNTVRATTPKIDDIGPLLDALVAAGGTNIEGPWFGMKDADAQLVGARGAAIKEAEAKAADYARLAGFRGAELVSISEGSFGGPMPPMPMVRLQAMDAGANKATPVEPGQVSNTLTLSFQYRLVK
ncbi:MULTISPECIES: SIMPL domain-containing protein [unclassified Sphingopyxis]|uniref:SIMPL domain-containing protein n=1 Tax=unclassified Sphingopyxis TaxID=2614943 RepID=UPI000AD4D5E4|nr:MULTISPECIES: SIMPL domain-containing protein [unclassified Sphingopyxis]